MMLMVGVTFRNQDAKASYRRFREKGRMMPGSPPPASLLGAMQRPAFAAGRWAAWA